MSATVLAPPTHKVVFDRAVEYVDRGLSTASWWDRYMIQPGEYLFRWTNSDGSDWNPDPNVRTNGFISNVGPYYAEAVMDALLVEEYRVNRLFSEYSVEHRQHTTPKVCPIRRNMYAYELKATARFRSHFYGGVVMAVN